jgi:hypothetical protein
MIVTAKEVREEFNNIWPDFEFNWYLDKKFYVPKLEEIENHFNRSKVHTMKFVKELNDCDDYAIQFKAEVQRFRYFAYMEGLIRQEDAYPYPLSVVFGNRFRGMNMPHATGMCLTEKGIRGIDLTPTIHRIWTPKADGDNPIFGYS